MKVIQARNVNDAFSKGMAALRSGYYETTSRNGKVWVAPTPVVTVYSRPNERVLFCPERDANPYFHLMESLWMLNGQRDAAWVTFFNKQMDAYTNEMGNYDGAYGYRWRYHFDMDQLTPIIEMLRAVPDTRRAVLTMFDPVTDLGADSLDIPCNTTIYFSIVAGELNMTVCNRSNDVIWGAYGANAVHMSMLHEVMAAMVRVKLGTYYQFSNNFHLYPDIKNHAELFAGNFHDHDWYISQGWPKFPVVNTPERWFSDLKLFMVDPISFNHMDNPFFYYVARPMYLSWVAHKGGDFAEALSWAEQIEDQAWSHACVHWLKRRAK